ncbi:MAG: Smr/MutS family protein [Treponema sp.]
MDFGDILDQWDSIKKAETQKKKSAPQISHKKANAPTQEEKEQSALKKTLQKVDEPKINAQELWMRRHGVVDKDALEEKAQARQKFKGRKELERMKIDDKIDLHGLTQDEARIRLESFVTDSERRGLKKILIVHGKGIHTRGADPVLATLVKKIIERDKRLGTSGHPDLSGGGTGATWVILKNNIFN